jgi:hypothetical protein
MFYEYPDSYAIYCRLFGKTSRDDMYRTIEGLIQDRSQVAMATLDWERSWHNSRRPYYRVWPKVLPMLLALNTNRVQASMMQLPQGLNELLVQLPFESPLEVRTIQLKSMMTSQGPGMMVGIFCGVFEGAAPSFDTWLFPTSDRCLEDTLAQLNVESDISVSTELRNQVMSLVATLCLIGNNPDLLQPALLTSDASKHNLTPADIERLVAKARRRGRLGWEVGKGIEVTPHFRRPHPALVWTGEGRKVPKVVIRKGALVHRNKITQVPTGYNSPP